MPHYRLTTTSRAVVIEASSLEQARRIFLREEAPPESPPAVDAHAADWQAFWRRWPVLDGARGECLSPGGYLLPEPICDACGGVGTIRQIGGRRTLCPRCAGVGDPGADADDDRNPPVEGWTPGQPSAWSDTEEARR